MRQNEAKCGPRSGQVWSQEWPSVVPGVAQWGNSGDTVGMPDPDPYHGGAPVLDRPARTPCPGYPLPCTPPRLPCGPTRVSPTVVHQASFGYNEKDKTVVLVENHCFVWKSLVLVEKSLFFPIFLCAKPRGVPVSEPTLGADNSEKCKKWSFSRIFMKKCKKWSFSRNFMKKCQFRDFPETPSLKHGSF